jgi:hypothetical protein
VAHGRETVCDHEGGAAGEQPVDRLLDEPLALRVERAGGLVEDEDLRVLEDRARDRDALAWPPDRTPTDRPRCRALGELARELVDVGGARGGRICSSVASGLP